MKRTISVLAIAFFGAVSVASGCSESAPSGGTQTSGGGGQAAGGSGQGGDAGSGLGGGGMGGGTGGGGGQPCSDASMCPGRDDACGTRTCEGGECGFDFVPASTPLERQTAGDCLVAVCDGAGATSSEPDSADVLDDQNPCTIDACDMGAPTNTPAPSGDPCSVGAGVFCDGAGACVECVAPGDCASGVCTGGACIPADCLDNVVNGSETDVDCGGGACAPCADGLGCAIAADCASSVCDPALLTCTVATCADAVENQDETDVDCGGATCAPCGPGLGCAVDGDCVGGACSGTLCLATCTDGVQNQDESATDCGGLVCGDCANGATCAQAADCSSNFCNGGLCAACVNDASCAGNEHCAAAICKPDLGVALACANDAQCLTGQCEDGLCCTTDCAGTCQACIGTKTGAADGTCANVLGATDPDGECAAGQCVTGTCNGSGACGNLASGALCGSSLSCSGATQTNQDTCSGGGACVDNGSTSCAPYVCGATTCKTSCVTAADCTGGALCIGSVCQSPLPQGSACTQNAECGSGACVDNVCCASSCTGTCFACSAAKTGAANGTCAAVLPSTDPDAECANGVACQTGLCNGAGACGNDAGGSPCGSSQSCVSGLQTNQDLCNGLGACLDNGTVSCGNFVCGASACLTTCALDIDCAAGNYCASGSCAPKLAQGAVCASNGQCAAGACVDGFCCNSACGGACQGCSAAKTGASNGTCASIPSGADPDNECAASSCTTGTCNGAAACGAVAAGTACGPAPLCASSVATLQDSCDGAGLCADAGTLSCGSYACSGVSCGTTCATSASCTPGFVCDTSKSVCVAQLCGDGLLQGSEACDDGNLTSYDGCSNLCVIEAGASCAGAPSVCNTLSEKKCNDGLDDEGDGLVDCADPNCALACDTTNFGTCGAGQVLVAASVTNPRRIYDLVAQLSPLDVAVSGTVTKAAVRLDVLHTFVSDLDIALIAPSGQSLDITSDNGAGGDNLVATILSDACVAAPVTAGAAPFTGCFGPETAFASITSAARGTWQLSVTDDTSSDTGLLSGWSLALCVDPAGTSCGNGVVNGGEGCDDGNNTVGDGCGSTCAVEAGFSCAAGSPSVCLPICGNNVVSGTKDCEDGNAVNGDGCSSTCLIEPGYGCFGTTTSTCARVCGDGVKTSDEACDDGNRIPGDGCDQGCSVEVAAAELEPNGSFANADTNAAAGLFIGGTSTFIAGAVPVIGDKDFYKMVLATPSTVRFELFEAYGVGCTTSTATTLNLFNAAQALIYTDNVSGFGFCSAIVVNLAAGTYYVQVEENQNNATIPSGYRLQVKVSAALTNEVEANDTIGTANAIAGYEVYQPGGHQVSTDPDHFKLVLGANTEIRAEVIEGGAETCESNEVNSKVTLLSSVGLSITSDDDTGRGNCALLDGQGSTEVLKPGVYFVRVESSSTQAFTTNQFDYRAVLSLR
jgi:cysteine-rich repeat protein